jgi:uncharacterized protein YutD
MTDRNEQGRITTYEQAFGLVLGLSFDYKLQKFVAGLEKEGHTEKSIAYSIWRTQDILKQYVKNHKYNNEFMVVLKKEILKYSWAKGDPRWETYWKKRNEEEKIKKKIKTINDYTKEEIDLTLKKVEERKKIDEEKKREKEKRYGKHKGFVYFIQGENGGAIKIGYSKDPEVRLKTLQTSYPDILKVLCLIPGNANTESKYHKAFEHLKLNGEWYKPDKEIFDEIEKLKAKYPHMVGD